MGMEDFGKKPAANKTEETRSWVNPITGEEELVPIEPAHVETVAAEVPAAPEVDTSFVELAGEKPVVANEQVPVAPLAASEQAPAIPLSPERKAEVMEQIGHEETRLNSNLAENETLLGAAEAKMNDPAVASVEAPTKPLLTRAKIGEAYNKATSKINEISLWAFTAGVGVMSSSMFAGIHAEKLKDNFDFVGSQDWMSNGTKLLEGGMATAAAAGGIWAISRSINWMKKKASERKVDNAYRAQAA
jgi:hypothetical protein